MISQTAVIFYDIFHTTDKEVFIEVTIGNGQAGSTLLSLAGVTIGNFDNSFKTSLGKSSDLLNKSISMNSNIHDINPDTDKVSLTIKLTGGKKDHEQSIINATVSNSGDTANALVLIRFF